MASDNALVTKVALKNGIAMRNLFPSFRTQTGPCIVVASNGRSGSTLVFDALRTANKKRYWPRKSKSAFEKRLAVAELAPGTIVKTHDFPTALKDKSNVKTLFCFGSSKDSALSVYSALDRFGRDWVNEHFEHLSATGPIEDLFQRDVLNQAEQVRQWATFEDAPVLCLNYEAIWSAQPIVEDFLGLKFTLPARVERARKSIPEDILAKASQVYDPIDAVLDKLPGVFEASSDYSDIFSERLR